MVDDAEARREAEAARFRAMDAERRAATEAAAKPAETDEERIRREAAEEKARIWSIDEVIQAASQLRPDQGRDKVLAYLEKQK